MSGMKDMKFKYGEDYQFPVTIKVDGTPQNLSGWAITLYFRDQVAGGSDFTKTNTDGVGDTDWITITTSASGLIKILVASPPVTITATGAAYIVDGTISKSGTIHSFGPPEGVLWEFSAPPAGALV